MKPLLTCLSLFSFYFLFSQSEFYDAKTLAAYVSPTSKKFAAEGPGQLDTIRQIFKKYNYAANGNPYLDAFISPGETFGTRDGTAPVGRFPSIKAVASMAGSLDVTNIADGIARFLIERGKEEVNVVVAFAPLVSGG